MDARAKELGLFGPKTLYGTRPRDMMFEASRNIQSGSSLLLSNNMSPEKFDSSIVAALESCYEGPVLLAEFDSIRKKALTWDWVDKPLYTVYGEGPSRVTPRDSIELTWSYFRALHRGVDRKLRARTDAVLAKHPEGSADRSQVLRRIDTVVRAGKTHERRVAARSGQSESELVANAKAVVERDSKHVQMHVPLCKSFVKEVRMDHSWERYSEVTHRTRPDRKAMLLDSVALDIASLTQAGCFARTKVLTAKQIVAQTRKALKRPHPSKLDDESCHKQAEMVGGWTSKAAPSHQELFQMLRMVQALRFQTCLLP